MKKLLVFLLIAVMLLGMVACGGKKTASSAPGITDPVKPEDSETPTPNRPASADVWATVTNGEETVEAESLSQILQAINENGKSKVVLWKDISTEIPIQLPYSCIVDFNGYTVRTSPNNGNGIEVLAAGTQKQTTVVRNGRLVHYDTGVFVKAGALTVDNMTIDSYYGAPVSIGETKGEYQHVIKNSQLSSKNYGCVVFNKEKGDFSNVTLTVEDTAMVSYKKKINSSSTVFVLGSSDLSANLVFGKNVDLYSYNRTYVADGYSSISGEEPVLRVDTVAVEVDGKTYTGINHWSTTPEQIPDPEKKEIPSTGPDYLVGYGIRDITPQKPVPLAGYGSTFRVSNGVYTPLMASAVAVSDRNGDTVMFLSVDQINPRGTTPDIREGIAAQTGIDPNSIMICYSHTHSGPDLANTSSTENMEEYAEFFVEQAIAAGVEAYNDRKAAEMYAGSITAEGLNFCRHYLMKDGTYKGSNAETSAIVQHAMEADDELRLILFKRDGAQGVLMMNWQAHSVMNSFLQSNAPIFGKISADIVAGIRQYVETELGYQFAYIQGGAGNVNPTSQIEGETQTKDIYEYGRLMGTYIKTCLQENMTKVEAGPVRSYAFVFRGNLNHADDHLLPLAKEVKELMDVKRNEALANIKAAAYGLTSYDNAMIMISKALKPQYLEERLTVLCIGNVGFAAMPHELFCDTGVKIREESPFDLTFIVAYSNDGHGYLPSAGAFEYDSYEVNSSSFAVDTADAMAAAFKEMWEKIYS